MQRWMGTGGPPSGTSTSASLQSRSGSRSSRSRFLLSRFRLTASTLPPLPAAATPPPHPWPAGNGGVWGGPGGGSATEQGLEPLDRYDDDDANVMDDDGSMASHNCQAQDASPYLCRTRTTTTMRWWSPQAVSAAKPRTFWLCTAKHPQFCALLGWLQANPRRQKPPRRDPS
uniref:Uncharacterized protein n=1 Tax=Zea mays TaxID=4577 RepID=C4J725_MAIZE|nr:unknown [Zea mays]ACR36976.1 unknown [Zea mays]